MRRILGFSALAGTLVGGATGAVFTPIGLVYGLGVGVLLGLLSGLWMGGMVRLDGPALTLGKARLLFVAPPLIVLALAVAAVVVVDARDGGAFGYFFIAVVAATVATPLILVVTWTGTAWCIEPLVPGAADDFSRPRMVRGLLCPVWVGGLVTAAWLVVFGVSL